VRGGWLVTFKQHDSGNSIVRVYVSDHALDAGQTPESAVATARAEVGHVLSEARSTSFEAIRVHGEVLR